MINVVKDRIEEIISLLENTGYYLINEQQKHSYKTFKKDDGSLLTELDIASEMLIKNELKGIFGDIGIISEESEINENVEIAKKKFFFLLDPIDGTKNFDKGKDFTINLAFCIDQQPVIGFVHNPIKKIILFGDNQQAFKKMNGKITKLEKAKQRNFNIKTQNELKKVVNLVIGKHNFENKTFVDNLILLLRHKGYNFSRFNLKSFSAMEKLFPLVNNEVDAFWSASCCKDWDILPSVPILKAVGAYFYTANPKVYFNNNFNSGKFIASINQELLDDLIDISNKIEKRCC